MTETINSIDYATGWTYSVSGTNVDNGGQSLSPKLNNQHSRSESPRGHRRAGNKSECWTRPVESELQNHPSRRGVSVHYNVHGSGHDEPNCDPKRDYSNQRHGYHKYLYAVIALLVSSPVSAADVGGVSATANPIADGSGSSVTNQAIQVLQGPYITNQYGGGVACQGPTANITPFVTHSRGYKDPFETTYMEPQYDARDFEGRMVEVQKNVKNWLGKLGMTIELIPTQKVRQ